MYYKQGNYTGEAPTLQDFYENLLKQKEPEARDLAVGIEMFVVGNMNTFAHQTNVNTKNRLICYDIHELNESLQSAGMLIVLGSIFNRITRNKREGRTTYIYISTKFICCSRTSIPPTSCIRSGSASANTALSVKHEKGRFKPRNRPITHTKKA